MSALRHPWRSVLLVLVSACSSLAPKVDPPARPNVIVILADDLGWGDVSCQGGLVPTPAIDSLARDGVRFPDAHSASAVCSPTRYALLTGRYAWRSSLKKGVLWGLSTPLIESDRPTIASHLTAAGYRTGVIGKWHLGLGWSKLEEARTASTGETQGSGWDVDFERKVTGGPSSLGFESSFLFPASLDMPPYVYLRDDVPVGVPSVTKSFKPPVRPGPATADFEAVRCLRDFAREAREFVSTEDERPFFLYLPLTSPHTPIEPAPDFAGRSGLGDYGDFLMETDWVVGQVLDELEACGLAENTLVLFTSDNGGSPMAQIPKLAQLGHHVNGPWRGHKADIFEGGHRVPLVARWCDRIEPGTVRDDLVSSLDLFATLADLAGALPGAGESPDGVSFARALVGEPGDSRIQFVHHSINGSFAIRRGRWKLCLCPGSGGWSEPKPPKSLERDDLAACQLYDLESDPGETINLFESRPDLSRELARELAQCLASSENDGWPGPLPPRVLETFPVLDVAQGDE